MAVAAGLLFAAIAVPTVAGIGVLTKTAISKFDHMAVPKLGLLPVRSEIYDRKGHLITYYYPNGIDRVPVTYNQISTSMRKAILAIEDAVLPARRDRPQGHDPNDQQPRAQGRAGRVHASQRYVKNALILTARPRRGSGDLRDPRPQAPRLRMAINVEHALTKNQLLAAYLSVAYFNNRPTACRSPRILHLGEEADAGPVRAAEAASWRTPLYNPLEHPGFAKARRNVVLEPGCCNCDISGPGPEAMSAPLGLDASTTAAGGLQRPVHQTGQGRVLLRLLSR
jgi:membrane peptidoglycan carboxypeptidase